MASVEDIAEALKHLGDNAPGIKKAFAFTPYTIESAELPCWIVWPSTANYGHTNSDFANDPRRFSILTLYGSFAKGREGDVHKLAYALHQQIKQYLLQQHAIQVGDKKEWVYITLNSDDGVNPRPYPPSSDKVYVGTGWTITADSREMRY